MAWQLTMVAVMLVAGLAISACASGGSASTPSCSAYRTALSVVLAVPKPGKSLDPASLAVLSPRVRQSMSKSRSTFLGAVAQEAHSHWAAAEAQYQQELTDATGGFAAGPPTPPPAARGRLVHGGRQPPDQILEVTGEPGTGPGEGTPSVRAPWVGQSIRRRSARTSRRHRPRSRCRHAVETGWVS
jgi:hypothetical protein